MEFDARLDYNCGGDCGLKQSVRQMYLNRIDDSRNSESLFICSNLGSYGSRNCTNSTHMSITYQGEDKYDLKLSLHSLNISNSGRYRLQVNLKNVEKKQSIILKEFNVTVRGMDFSQTSYYDSILDAVFPTFPTDPSLVPRPSPLPFPLFCSCLLHCC